MTPKLAIFDCDGVLVDSEGPVSDLLVTDLNRRGLSVTHAEVPALFTGGTIESVAATARARGADLPDSWADDIYQDVYALMAEGIPLVDGVLPLIDALEQAGTTIWVASNGTMHKMELSLGPSGLWDRFAGRIMSREAHAPKPDPAMILHAMEQSGAGAAETVFIDDSPTGCRAGIAAGVRTIGFAAETDPDTLALLGVEVVRSMSALHPLLLGLAPAQ